MKEFATLIRKARIDIGYSQDYVSSELGITVSAYSKIERGLTDPSLSRMKQIAGILEGDILTKIGTCEIKEVYGYMDCLSKLKIGDEREVTVIRKGEELKFKVIF